MPADATLIESLSPQQIACLRLVADLRTSKQISELLGISSHTVDTHLSNAVRKLGVSSRMEAARLLVEASPNPPERLTDQSPPVAEAAVIPSEPSSQLVAAPVGRQVTLPRWTRLVIIAGGAVALVYAVVLIIVGAEVLTRMARSYSHPTNAEATSSRAGASRET
ncbi:helix-turn-helix domain-containing protein [Sphingomonas rubra]|uniref:Regulatory protein, luxR family n=1 Tax=Sphingomonas rubra TaxID=634430 RepID=A0A1I5SI16_9SPHN|nr:helix-turn-helix transcriptional regulator [Sphingomonas rubra]SFP70410.1 regulatory protein, luxR family [Sphingomonas rubra]